MKQEKRNRKPTKIRNWPSRKNRSQNPLQKRNRRGKKTPRKSPLGKSLLKKNRKAKAALEREVKREREIAEREQENENSAGWLPEMSFQTVLLIVGIPFTAFELYQRFRQKDSSGSVQSPISQITAEAKQEPQAEPNNSEAPGNDEEQSAVSSKFGMV